MTIGDQFNERSTDTVEHIFMDDINDISHLNLADEFAAEARSMHLLPATGVVSWPARRVREKLPILAAQVADLISHHSSEPGWPDPAFVPPNRPGSVPRHRLWIARQIAEEVPWEAARTLSGNEIFCDQRFSVVYSAARPSSNIERYLVPPPKILIMTAMPAGIPSANVELQRTAITRGVASCQVEQMIEVEWFTHPDLGVIRNHIMAGQFSSIHIIAHGRPGQILWYGIDGDPVWHGSRDFVDAFSGIPLSIVSWMVCYSGSSSASEPSLLQMGVDQLAPAGIGMRGMIDDLSAARFAEKYFAALGSAPLVSLDAAVSSGRAAIRDMSSRPTSSAIAHTFPMLSFRFRPVVVSLTATTPISRAEPSPPENSTIGGVAGSKLTVLGRFNGADQARIVASSHLRVGRSLAADIVINSITAAPFQVTLTVEDGRWFVVDEQTGRSTLINGVPMSSTRQLVGSGDTLRVGDVDLILQYLG